MEEKLMNERKKIILDIINSEEYIPMKLKELAIILNIPKDRRSELEEVLDALLAEGKIGISKKANMVSRVLMY